MKCLAPPKRQIGGEWTERVLDNYAQVYKGGRRVLLWEKSVKNLAECGLLLAPVWNVCTVKNRSDDDSRHDT